MKKLLAVALMCFLLLSGCAGYTQEETDSMVNEAAASASSEAYEEGFLDGKNEGFSSGYSEGYETGKEEGYSAGQDDAKLDFAQVQTDWFDLLKEEPPEGIALLYTNSEDLSCQFQAENRSDQPAVIRIIQYGINRSSNAIADYYIAAHSGTVCMTFEGDCDIFIATGQGDWFGRKLLWLDNTECYQFTSPISFDSSFEGLCFVTIDNALNNGVDLASISLEDYAAPDPTRDSSDFTLPDTSASELPIDSQIDPQGETVWVSTSGSKYHSNAGCSNMKNPQQITLEEAIARGYEPCKKCY